MKKFAPLALLLALFAVTVGCKKEGEKAPAAAPPAAPSEPAGGETPAAPAEGASS